MFDLAGMMKNLPPPITGVCTTQFTFTNDSIISEETDINLNPQRITKTIDLKKIQEDWNEMLLEDLRRARLIERILKIQKIRSRIENTRGME